MAGAICPVGHSTRVLQEKFVMMFSIPDFKINEAYKEARVQNVVKLVHSITFKKRTSDRCYIGQSINLPSTWCINVNHDETFLSVGLMLQSIWYERLNPGNAEAIPFPSAFCKFRISLVDKEGDTLYETKWNSWTKPVRIIMGDAHTLPVFLTLVELLEGKELFIQNDTLRFKCEGVLYSNPQHTSHFIQRPSMKRTVSPLSLKLWENEMEFGDVELISLEETPVKAHRSILSNSGNVFHRLMQTLDDESESGASSKPMKLYLDVSERDIRTILQFIYTGGINQDCTDFKQVQKLMGFAREYEIVGLKPYCADIIAKNISMSNFIDVMRQFQFQFDDRDLLKVLNKFYLDNMSKLIDQDRFKLFALECNKAFLDVTLFY